MAKSISNSKLASFLGKLGLTVFILLIIGILLRLSLRTDFVLNKIEEQIENSFTSDSTSLDIENMKGDAWNSLVILNASYNENGVQSFTTEITLKYQVLDFLLDQIVDEALIDGLSVQLADSKVYSGSTGTWFELLVRNFEMKNSNIQSKGLQFQNLEMSGEAHITEVPFIKVYELSTSIIQKDLADTLFISTRAEFIDARLNLNELIIKTGSSVIESTFDIGLDDESFSATGEASPIFLSDLFESEYELNLSDRFVIDSFELGGDFNDFRIRLNGEADFSQSFDLQLSISNGELLEVTDLELGLTNFSADNLHKKIQELDASSLNFSMTNLEGFTTDEPSADFKIAMQNLNLNGERFERFNATGNIQNDDLKADLKLERIRNRESIEAEVVAESFVSEMQDWQMNGKISGINPGWLTGKDVNGSITGTFSIDGKGFDLSTKKWNYSFNSQLGYINNQAYDKFQIDGWVDQYSTEFELVAGLRGSVFEGVFTSTVAENVPKYGFNILASNINLEDITGFSETKSNISFELKGNGEGTSSDNLILNIEADLKDGRLNTGTIRELAADIKVRDEYITIENALILSTFADGTISAYQNYTDLGDPNNLAEFALQLKELDPLSSIFNVDQLNAEGRISGAVTQTTDGFSFFTSNFDLVDVEVDEKAKADSISGNVEVVYGNQTEYSVALNIQSPAYYNIDFEDLKLDSYGLVREDSVQGSFEFKIEGDDAGRVDQFGFFNIDKKTDRIEATLSRFDYLTADEAYLLQSPFTVTVSPEAIIIDTLFLQGQEDSYIWLSFSQYESGVDACFIKGEDVNLGVFQDLFLKEKYLDGDISGELEIAIVDSSLEANGIFEVKDLGYKESVIDNFTVILDVIEDELDLEFSGKWDGEEHLTGNLTAPFQTGDADTFSAEFLNQDVNGELRLNTPEIHKFSDLLGLIDLENLRGEAEALVTLSGKAGNPDLNGQLFIDKPIISGVKLDSLIAELNYDHDETDLFVESSLYVLNQRATDFEAILPFEIDFQDFDLIVPSDNDRIFMNLQTNNLNLAVFNDFVDEEYLAGIGGRVEGDLTLSGTFGKVYPSGDFQVINSKFEVPYTNIAVKNINASVKIDSSLAEIQQLVAESDDGILDVLGFIELDGINATNLDISINSNEFLVSDTPDAQLWLSTSSNLGGTFDYPELVGELLVNDGFIYSSKLGEGGLESVSLESDTLGLIITSTDFYKRLNVDMNLELAEGFSFRNRDYLTIDIEALDGELNAQKESYGELALIGSLNSEVGFARPLGKRFNLEKAEFIFDGDPFNPEIFNDFEYQPVQSKRKTEQQVYINYIIEGTLNDPEYRFESDPEMDRQDIIGYVLFNRPFYRLDPVEQLLVDTNSKDEVDEESLDLLLSRVEQLATQSFGVDLVEVSSIRVGNERGTSIQTGWFINERTFFRIVNEIGATTPRTLFMLEYLINQNLDLIITQGNDRRQGIDFQWIFEY